MTTTQLSIQDAMTPADATMCDDALADPVSTATTTPADDALDTDVWSVACHESGHAVAASVLLGLSARSLVWYDGGGIQGVTLMASHIGGFNFRRCIILACGALAERLARSHPRPCRAMTPTMPRRKLEVDAPETVDKLRRLLRESQPLSDEDNLARMFGEFDTACLSGWRMYRRREISVQWHARRFVFEHKHRILAVAERLYIAAQTVLKGVWNYDNEAIELTDHVGEQRIAARV